MADSTVRTTTGDTQYEMLQLVRCMKKMMERREKRAAAKITKRLLRPNRRRTTATTAAAEPQPEIGGAGASIMGILLRIADALTADARTTPAAEPTVESVDMGSTSESRDDLGDSTPDASHGNSTSATVGGPVNIFGMLLQIVEALKDVGQR